MSFELTSERLQQIAVNCVTQFISKQASLNEAIAKEAMELELNPDQTKRVIEASNTIAYLRQLEKSADRTFEFDVADYSKVMATMCLPDDMLKTAGTPPWLDKDKDKKEDSKEDDKGEEKDPRDKDNADEEKHKGEDFGTRPGGEDKEEDKDDKKKSKDKDDKDESEDEDNEDKDKDHECSDEEKQEKRAMLMRGYFQSKETLEKMAYDEAGLVMELTRSAGVVAKDRHGLEKLAHVVESEDLDKVTRLCGIEKRAEEDIIVVDRDLKDVRAFYSLYKEAQAFLVKKAELTDFVTRAETLLFKQPVDLEKQAIFGAVAKGVGWAMGKTLNNPGTRGLGGVISGARTFKSQAAKSGFTNTEEAIRAYDKIKKTKGPKVAERTFGGTKPGVGARVWGKVGVSGLLTATTGLSMDHKNNIKDLK